MRTNIYVVEPTNRTTEVNGYFSNSWSLKQRQLTSKTRNREQNESHVAVHGSSSSLVVGFFSGSPKKRR